MGEVRALIAAMRLIDVPWTSVIRAITLGTLALGSAVGLGAASAWLIARASQMPPVLSLSMVVVTVRALGISRGLMRYLERLASHQVALKSMGALRTALYERLATGPTGVVSTLRRGDVLARIGADVDHVGDVVVRAIIPAAVSASVSLLSIVAMMLLLPEGGLWLALGLAIAGILGPWLTALGARRAETDSAAARGEVTARSLDLVDHASEMIVTGNVAAAIKSLRTADQRWKDSTQAGARALAAGAAAGTLGLAVAVLGALLAGIPAVTSGRLGEVTLAVVVLTPLAAFESTLVLPAAAIQLHRSGAAALRLSDLLERTGVSPTTDRAAQRATDRAAQRDADRAAQRAEILHHQRNDDHAQSISAASQDREAVIELIDLKVGWSPDTPAAEIGSLRLSRGTSAVIVGPSGSGKTTLLATIAGLIDPIAGTVHTSGPALLTTEDAHVFQTTVLENLRVARGDVDADEARAALNLAGLTPWLTSLPNGLDTMVGADASTISGGERRRLLIARSLVARQPILLIDEPAEHLDRASADALVKDLLSLPARTAGSDHPVEAVVIASHHLGAIDFADQVIRVTAAISQ
ncbi:ATP-binding cassette, subfamily C, CydC [Micrococcales bacterium KH10]|nr:ATP-binding cassette, subfamily C, CydC [Micrococcales bacterium KH10]